MNYGYNSGRPQQQRQKRQMQQLQPQTRHDCVVVGLMTVATLSQIAKDTFDVALCSTDIVAPLPFVCVVSSTQYGREERCTSPEGVTQVKSNETQVKSNEGKSFE